MGSDKRRDLAKVEMKPLQTLPNMMAAVKSNQVDGALIAPHLARGMIDRGEAKLIGWFSDLAQYQFGALFVATKVATGNRGGFEIAVVYKSVSVPPVKKFKVCPIF